MFMACEEWMMKVMKVYVSEGNALKYMEAEG